MMEDQRLPLDRDQTPSIDSPDDDVPGDQIIVGNMDHTVAAIGRGASVIVNQALSEADNARAKEDFEHEKLARAVPNLITTLYNQMQKVQPATNSPYKYLLPFEFGDAWRFFGRDAFRDEIVSAIHSAGLLVLHGDAGMGKTSLLRASVAPALVAEGHLPLLVRISHEPVATSVKRSLLSNLAPLPYLKDAPLSEFLRQVNDLLPEGKQVYVLMDQFEEFLALPPAERERFTSELADCLFAEPPIGHWLLSVQSAKVGYLSTLEPTIPHPTANNLILPPLTPAQARDAILKPAELAGLQVEEQLVNELLQDLGGDAIDPSKLQLVCHTLAQSARTTGMVINLPTYIKAGRAETILRDHLTMVLQQNLPPEDSKPAWQTLSVIAKHPAGISQEMVVSELKTYQIAPEKSLRVLGMLEINRLIRLQRQVYQLTSPSLLEPIRKWADQQAALEQAQIEARRQLERVRNSALRGLFGGGGAFILAYLLTYLDQTVDWLVVPLVALFEGLAGGVAGIFFIFALDIAQASFHGRLRWMRVLWGGLAGALLFSVAFLFHKLLHFPASPQIIGAAIEGGMWGLVAGAGTAVVVLSTRPLWQTMPLFTVLSALTLWLGEKLGLAYHRPRIAVGTGNIDLFVFLAGAVMYLALAGAALWGKQREASRPKPEAQPAGSGTGV